MMETGGVIIQEPVSTKTSVEEASAGVVLLDHLPMEIVDKVNMSTVLDDEVKSREFGNSIAEVRNGSGGKETEEKGEAIKPISVVEDSTIVKEKASETGQGSISVNEPESFNINTEKGKDDGITQRSEEAIFENQRQEDQTNAKIPAEQESVPKDVTDEVRDSPSVETSVNETEAEPKATVPVEEILRNIVNEDDGEGQKEEPDAEKNSNKVTGDREKEEDMTRKVDEVQESPLVIETLRVQGENIASKASKDTEEHEHAFVREEPQIETLVTEAGAVNTSTVQVSDKQPIIDEDHAKTIHSVEPEEEIGTISEKSGEQDIEKSSDSACEEIPKKTDQVNEEKDSRIIETSVNGSEAEHNATVPVEEISTNSENIVNVNAPEEETATYGVSFHDVDTTKRVLEAEKDAVPRLDAKEKDESETVKKVIGDPEVVNNDLESLKENEEKNSDEVAVDRRKEEDTIPKTEEVRETCREIETPTIQGEDTGSKASLDQEEDVEEVQENPLVIETSTVQGENIASKASEDTEEHEDAFVREEPHNENLVTEAEAANTSSGQEATIGGENMEQPVIDEGHPKTKHSAEQKEVSSATAPVKSDEQDTEKSSDSASEETPIKTDQGKDVETSVNASEAEHNPTVGVEEISTNIVKVNAPEEETATYGESLHDVETTNRVLEAETRLDAKEKDESETVTKAIGDPEIVNNEETTVHENAEKISDEVAVNRGKEEEIIPKIEELRGTSREIETATIKGEDISSKASLDHEEEVDKSSKETEEHEQVLVGDIPHGETLVTEAETVDIHKNLKTEDDTETSLHLKENKGEEETEMVKTVISPADGVKSSNVEAEEFGEHSESCSSEIKEEGHRREESVEVKSKETVQDEVTEEKHENLLDIPSKETEKYKDTEPETALVADTEGREKCEEVPLDLTLKVDKEELKDDEIKKDQVDGTQTMEKQKGLDSNEPEAERTDRNIMDETEESPAEKLVALESPPEISEETRKALNEKIKETPEEDHEEDSYAMETKQETDSVPKSSELGDKVGEERSVVDLTPLQEEPQLPNEQEKETMSQKEEIAKHEETTQQVIDVSSPSPSAELESETVLKTEKVEKTIADGDEQAADEVEPHSSLRSSSEEKEHGTVSEKIENEEVKNVDEEITARDMPQDEPTVTEVVLDTSPIQEAPLEIETPTTKGEEISSKASLDHEEEVDKSSKETKEHEHVLVSDIPHGENVDILKTSETKEDTETKTKEDEEIKEEEALVQTTSDEDATKGQDGFSKAGTEIGETKANESEDANEHVESSTSLTFSEISDDETLTAEAKKGDEATATEMVLDTSPIQEAAISKTLETTITESEAVHSPTGVEEESQETKEDTELSLDLKEETAILSDEVKSSDVQVEEFGEQTEHCSSDIKDEGQGREEHVEAKPREIFQDKSTQEKDENLLDEASEESPETMQKTSLGSSSELVEETRETIDVGIEEKPKEEVTLHQVDQEEGSYGLETKEETVSVPESRDLGEKSQEEESCLPNEQEEETKLQKEHTEKPEPKHEQVSDNQQSLVEENFDEPSKVSSASSSEKVEAETSVEAEMEDIKTKEEVADKIQKSVETVEIAEPHSQIPLSSEKQEHATVSEAEKTVYETEKETEPTGDMSEKVRDISETTDMSLPSVALSLHEEEKVTSTESGEAKAKDSEDENLNEHVSSPTSPMLSPKNDDETVVADAKKVDEEITSGLDGSSTSKVSENECIKQGESDNLEVPKLEESNEDKSHEISETIKATEASGEQASLTETQTSELVSEQDDQTPKVVEEIHETTHADQILSLKQVYEQIDHTTKGGEEIDEEETSKLEAEEIHPAEIIPRESSSEVPVSMLAAKEDDQETLQESNCAGDGTEIKDTQGELLVSTEGTKTKESVDETGNEHVDSPTSSMFSRKNDDDTLTAEVKEGDEGTDEIKTTGASDSSGTLKTSKNVCEQEEFENPEPSKLEVSKEDESQEISETREATEATGGQTFPIETSQPETLASELVSVLDDQTPRKAEEIGEEETKEEHKLEAKGDQILPVQTLQADQTLSFVSELEDQIPKQVEEIYEEETKEAHKLQGAVNQILPVETSQAEQTPSLVAEQDEQTTKQAEELHEEGTKEAQKLQAEEILPETVSRESFSEAPVSMLASGEDERHVSAETEERVQETKPETVEVEGTQKSNDQDETSTKLTKEEDEITKKTNGESISTTPENEATEDESSLRNDYQDSTTGEEEHEDDGSSNLPVVDILRGLHTELEPEREIGGPASLGENMITEPTEKVQQTSDAEVVSNEEHSAAEIIEANRLQQEESGEIEKVQEDNSLAEKSLPVEELNLQEEVKVQDGISRESEVDVKEKLQEEETREIAEKQKEHKAQEDAKTSTAEKISGQEEHARDLEISKKVGDDSDQVMEDQPHTVKEEDQIDDIKDVTKTEEVQDEKLGGVSATTDTEESKDHEGPDFPLPQVEKEEEPHSLLVKDEEIKDVVTSEKQTRDPEGVTKNAEHESYEEHVEPLVILDDTKAKKDGEFPAEQAQRDPIEEVQAEKSLTEDAVSEQIQALSSAVPDIQSPHQVEETSFEVKKENECKNEENVEQVKDEPMNSEAPAEQEQKSSDATYVHEDIGTNVKEENRERGDGHDSVVVQKDETGLIEEKREVEKTELEDAVKHRASTEERNNTSEQIYEEESKQDHSVKEPTAVVQPHQSPNQVEEKKEKEGINEENVDTLKDELKNSEAPLQDKDTYEQEHKSTEEQREVEKTELEGAIKRGGSIEERNDTSETIDPETSKQIYEEESKQTDTKTAIKEESTEEKELSVGSQEMLAEKKTEETTQDAATEKTKPEDLSLVSDIQDMPKEIEEQKQEGLPNQQKREIAGEVETVKVAEESENPKDVNSEPARKSLSDLIPIVKGTNKTEEDATTEPRIEEEGEDGDDKTSPDSLVMVEAKDTVHVIKTQHKKSHGILSGVGSKVKHSISKVKKALTGKSSHTTKPSSPK